MNTSFDSFFNVLQKVFWAQLDPVKLKSIKFKKTAGDCKKVIDPAVFVNSRSSISTELHDTKRTNAKLSKSYRMI